MDEAIALASEPLLSAQYIEPQYVEAMQQHLMILMVIQNNIAIPHAMSDGGVKRTAMSMLVLQEPLIINKQHPIHIIVVIAATMSKTLETFVTAKRFGTKATKISTVFKKHKQYKKSFKLLNSIPKLNKNEVRLDDKNKY